MGVSLKIAGYPFNLTNYSVSEDATPLAAGDSFGGTGTITFDLLKPDLDALGPVPGAGGWGRVQEQGTNWFVDRSFVLEDTTKGRVTGVIESVRRGDTDASIILSGTSRLGELNVYGVQAQPYIGTLGGAFAYYLSLADITTGFNVDSRIASRYVVYQGWTGELWFYLKQMAVAQDCDISLVDGTILLRPIRDRVASKGRDIDRSFEIGGTTLARSVEVYRYNSTPITNELVWPAGGWVPETEVQNVNAGEDAEYVLELSASVTSIQQPVMVDNVDPDYSASSVYTIIANDGLAVSKDAWEQNGGKVKITIEPDTKSLRVKLHGARGLPTVSGGPATNFSLALASDTTGNQYSTLRIVGTGVSFDKQKLAIPTTVPANKTATEVGVTVDNIFLNSVDDQYRAGVRAALSFSGYQPSLSGSVFTINPRDENGNEDFQVFGNVQGCRVWDKASKRWYRIRTGTETPAVIQSFQADDDLTHGDAEEAYIGMTYGDVQSARSGFTYKEDNLAGLYVKPPVVPGRGYGRSPYGRSPYGR